MAAKRPSWIGKRYDFRNTESLCHSNAFHQVSTQFDLHLRFGRCLLKNFKMAVVTMAAILDSGMDQI